jgi:hypothetical protein
LLKGLSGFGSSAVEMGRTNKLNVEPVEQATFTDCEVFGLSFTLVFDTGL